MARPLLADPEFVRKAAAGRADEINTCIACNQACLDHAFSNQQGVLPGQPAGLPRDRAGAAAARPARDRATVAVVGAGPAGLAAAVSAAERGFAVTLFEKDAEIGGQFRLAMAVPGKEEFAETLRYYTPPARGARRRRAARHEAAAADLAAYDEVVVATGVVPRMPEHPRHRPPQRGVLRRRAQRARSSPGRGSR